MKICCFYTDNYLASWSLCRGFINTLRRMNHEVLTGAIPVAYSVDKSDEEGFRKRFPTYEQLQSSDLIICVGIEYYLGWLQWLYGDKWFKIKTPISAWAIESNARDDRYHYYEKMQEWANFWFYPDIFDSDNLKGTWLPFGVDTEVFTMNYGVQKQWDFASISNMYPIREAFYNNLKTKLNGIKFTVGDILVRGIEGNDIDATTKYYVDTINKIRCFICFPTHNHCVVTKFYEVMACGVPIIGQLPTGDKRNWLGMDSVMRYDTADQLAEIMTDIVKHDNWNVLNQLSLDGYEYCRLNHSLENRINKILEVSK